MQNILSKYSILYLTNHTNRLAHKDYFSNPKCVTWEAVLNVQDQFTVPPHPLLAPNVLTPLNASSLQQLFPSASLYFMVLIRHASTQSPPLTALAEWLESNQNKSNRPRQQLMKVKVGVKIQKKNMSLMKTNQIGPDSRQ